MKTKLLHLLALVVLVSALLGCKKSGIKADNTQTHTLESSQTGENYSLKVMVPEGYSSQIYYPVVYLLDGHYHFDDVANSLLSRSEIDPVILVGIEYADYPFSLSNLGKIEELREVDLTYPVHVTQSGSELGGGGELFFEALRSEILPFVESEYAVDTTERTLMGHSLGGYFTLYQMFAHREEVLFPNVVALSPSLWWADLEILRMEQEAADSAWTLPFELYIGNGTQEGVEGNAQVDELTERMEAHDLDQLELTSERYSGGHLFSAKEGFEQALIKFY